VEDPGVWKVGKSLLRNPGVGGSEGHDKEILDVGFVEEFSSSDRRTVSLSVQDNCLAISHWR
jgi:hypothetical protein